MNINVLNYIIIIKNWKIFFCDDDVNFYKNHIYNISYYDKNLPNIIKEMVFYKNEF